MPQVTPNPEAKAARSALRLVSTEGVRPDTTSPAIGKLSAQKHLKPNPASSKASPPSNFSNAELDWLRTTAEAETGLSLKLDKDGDERGHSIYVHDPMDAPQHPWFLLALPSGASLEHFVENTEATDKFDTHIGPPALFQSLRHALAFIAAENYGQDAMTA